MTIDYVEQITWIDYFRYIPSGWFQIKKKLNPNESKKIRYHGKYRESKLSGNGD